MTLDIRDTYVVGEVSGMVVAEVGDGKVIMESPLESMEGTDPSSIDRQTRRIGEYVETITVSGSPSIHLRILIPRQIMAIARVVPFASTPTEMMQLYLRS